MNDSERVSLSLEAAIAMLPEGSEIHTFVNPGAGLLVGADWSRDAVIELLKTGKPELSGEEATKMNHGIVAWDGEKYVFVQTKSQE